jgi:hypothetical protein
VYVWGWGQTGCLELVHVSVGGGLAMGGQEGCSGTAAPCLQQGGGRSRGPRGCCEARTKCGRTEQDKTVGHTVHRPRHVRADRLSVVAVTAGPAAASAPSSRGSRAGAEGGGVSSAAGAGQGTDVIMLPRHAPLMYGYHSSLWHHSPRLHCCSCAAAGLKLCQPTCLGCKPNYPPGMPPVVHRPSLDCHIHTAAGSFCVNTCKLAWPTGRLTHILCRPLSLS